MSNYAGDLNQLFEFYAKDIAKEDGTLGEDSTPAYIYTYDVNDSSAVNTTTYTSGDNSGHVLTVPLKDSDDSSYGYISYTSDRIKIGSTEYLKETAIITNGTTSFLKASSFYEDSGSGGISGAGSAVFYVETTCSCFATIKRVKIIYNSDGTRSVRFYTNLKGDLLDPVA